MTTDEAIQLLTVAKEMEIKNLIDLFKDGDLFAPKFQRKTGMWVPWEKEKLIRDIIAGNSSTIPSLTFSDTSGWDGDAQNVIAILDGLQRISTVTDFWDGKFKLDGKFYKDLSTSEQQAFKSAKFLIGFTRGLSYEESRLRFEAMNTTGKGLKLGQILKGVESVPAYETVSNIVAAIIPLLPKKESTKNEEEWKIATLLLLNTDGFCSDNPKKIIEAFGNMSNAVAKQREALLKTPLRVAKEIITRVSKDFPFNKTRAASLFCQMSVALAQLGGPELTGQGYAGLTKAVRDALVIEQGTHPLNFKGDNYAKIKEAICAYLYEHPEAVKDRPFTSQERLEIWQRAEGRCQICNSDVPLECMEADHIEGRFSMSGKSVLENGQCLCVPCHKEKHRTDIAVAAVGA